MTSGIIHDDFRNHFMTNDLMESLLDDVMGKFYGNWLIDDSLHSIHPLITAIELVGNESRRVHEDS